MQVEGMINQGVEVLNADGSMVSRRDCFDVDAHIFGAIDGAVYQSGQHIGQGVLVDIDRKFSGNVVDKDVVFSDGEGLQTGDKLADSLVNRCSCGWGFGASEIADEGTGRRAGLHTNQILKGAKK